MKTLKKLIICLSIFMGFFGFVSSGFCTEDALVVDEQGRVGIGVSSPKANLHVKGNIVSENGNIGIGIIVPQAKLHVFGEVSVNKAAAPLAPLDVEGAIRSISYAYNGALPKNIAVAIGHTSYMVMVSNNHDTGNNVRSAIYHILLNNEGTAISFQSTISNFNNMVTTFNVASGMLQISAISPGNNTVAVFMN